MATRSRFAASVAVGSTAILGAAAWLVPHIRAMEAD